MAGGQIWGVWVQTVDNDTGADSVERFGEVVDMADAFSSGAVREFCDGQTSPVPPRWPDDSMQLIYTYDRESAELISDFLRGSVRERVSNGWLVPSAPPSWLNAIPPVPPIPPAPPTPPDAGPPDVTDPGAPPVAPDAAGTTPAPPTTPAGRYSSAPLTPAEIQQRDALISTYSRNSPAKINIPDTSRAMTKAETAAMRSMIESMPPEFQRMLIDENRPVVFVVSRAGSSSYCSVTRSGDMFVVIDPHALATAQTSGMRHLQHEFLHAMQTRDNLESALYRITGTGQVAHDARMALVDDMLARGIPLPEHGLTDSQGVRFCMLANDRWLTDSALGEAVAMAGESYTGAAQTVAQHADAFLAMQQKLGAEYVFNLPQGFASMPAYSSPSAILSEIAAARRAAAPVPTNSFSFANSLAGRTTASAAVDPTAVARRVPTRDEAEKIVSWWRETFLDMPAPPAATP